MKNTVNIGDRLEKYIYSNEITDSEWLKILNLAETYGGVKSVKQYSKDNNISVQGVYKHRQVHSFINSKFVIDSDWLKLLRLLVRSPAKISNKNRKE